jgi:hypothetical protein
MLLKQSIFYFNVLILIISANAQENNIPIGEWRVHLPYNIIRSVEVVGNQTYAAANVNAFYVDHADNSLNILSKVNSLSDVGVNKIKYHTGLNILLMGYENGNIDLIKDNSVTNINDIERKAIVGSKKINHIHYQGNFAYLSCDFGVSVLDLIKYEIKETYSNLAPGGLTNKVFSCTFSSDGDSIFLATEKGLMTARNSPTVNLMDFSNWYTYGAANNISTTNVLAVCNFNNRIYAGVNNDSLYFLNGSIWQKSSIPLDSTLRSINVSRNKLLISAGERVLIAENESAYSYITHPAIQNPSEAVFDGNDKIWIGDLVQGLFSDKEGSIKSYKPNAPGSKEVFNLYYYNNTIIVSAGGYNKGYGFLYRPAEFYFFDNYTWQTFNKYTPGFPDISDLTSASYNPYDNKLYLSSHGYGILVKNPNDTYSLIDDTNSPLTRNLPTPGPYVFVTDTEVDKDGNLWVTAMVAADPSLHMKKPDGSWVSKSFGFEASKYPLEIIIDDNNYKWIRLRPGTGGGIIVYNDKTGIYKYLTNQAGQGGLPSMNISAFVKDKKGEIWIGTEEGIAIFYNPESLFSGSIDASIPLFDGFPLLYNEAITCIEVDGGNRKWIGTENGLWLFNDDGTEVISNFTTTNSPLLSNYIIDVMINENTGEVFIATDKGLISYRGTASTGKTTHSNVKVFPNPVKPDFKGLVGISGLAKDAAVKITDIYGNLIYETKAEGGTAVWNVENYNGARAKTGVYLIFSADETGKESFVSKIAVVE